MSSPLSPTWRPKLIATKQSSAGNIVRVFEPEAAEGAAGYLICWIKGHGHSINDPPSCPYCTKPIGPDVFPQTHCPYCSGIVREVDFARNCCAHCDTKTTSSERCAWILNAEFGKRERARKRAPEKHWHSECSHLFTEPASARYMAQIAVYSLEGKPPGHNGQLQTCGPLGYITRSSLD